MSVLSEINRIKSAVTDIINAIKAKGVTVPTTAKIGDLAALVSSISTAPSVSYSYSAVAMWDDEAWGPMNVTYKVEENGKLVNKTIVLQGNGNIIIMAVRGTEIYINKALNCYAQNWEGNTIDIQYRHADGGMYIAVPNYEYCLITITS